jgi:ElaB/YqjD/DUF883 family membrane-anchored ribosome-binding protein
MAEENKPEQRPAGTADAQDKLQSSKDHARRAAEDLKSAAGAFAEEYRGRQSRLGATHATKQNKRGVMPGSLWTFQDDAEQYVRNPTKAIFTALGIGFVLGQVFRR